MPVEVPPREVRESLHAKVQVFAASLWSQYVNTESLLDETIGL
jgi:hypothetical protein